MGKTPLQTNTYAFSLPSCQRRLASSSFIRLLNRFPPDTAITGSAQTLELLCQCQRIILGKGIIGRVIIEVSIFQPLCSLLVAGFVMIQHRHPGNLLQGGSRQGIAPRRTISHAGGINVPNARQHHACHQIYSVQTGILIVRLILINRIGHIAIQMICLSRRITRYLFPEAMALKVNSSQ